MKNIDELLGVAKLSELMRKYLLIYFQVPLLKW